MKVLFQSRKTLFEAPGGDTIQLLKTKEYLERQGIDVDISLDLEPILDKYDIVHVFNLMRGQEVLLQVRNAKKQGKRVALSTIYGLYTEFERYGRAGVSKYLARILSPYQIEYLKIAARTFIGREFHNGSIQLLIKGFKNTLKEITKNVDVFLPNSQSEMNRVISDFNLRNPSYVVVPNAADVEKFSLDIPVSEEVKQYKDCILSVARLEGRKCQLELIHAIGKTDKKLLLIGKTGKNQQAYGTALRTAAMEYNNIFFLDHVDHQMLPQYYKICKIHALISWMETPGLSSLEAALMGKNIVITDKGDTRDYFEDYAYYCEPGNVKSIQKAVLEAYNAPENPKLRKHIIDHFTWEKAAARTMEAYVKI